MLESGMSDIFREAVRVFTDIHQAYARVERVIRWGSFKERKLEQRTDRHMLSVSALAIVLCEIEREYGKNNLDAFMVVSHAVLHDLGEGGTGDFTHQAKKDPRLNFLIKSVEDELADEMLSNIPIIGNYLKKHFDLDQTSLEYKFFKGIESLECLFYGINEVVQGNLSFVVVVRDSHESTLEFAKEFPSFGFIYTEDVQRSVVELIESHKDRIDEDGRRTYIPTIKHAKDMLSALLDLISKLSPDDQAAMAKEVLSAIKKKGV